MLQPAWMAFFNADLLRPSEDAVFPHAGCVRYQAPDWRSACTRWRATRAIVRTSTFGSLAELGVFFGIGGWHLWRWVAPATVIHSEQPIARIAVLPLLVVMNQQTTAMIQQQVQKCRSK